MYVPLVCCTLMIEMKRFQIIKYHVLLVREYQYVTRNEMTTQGKQVRTSQ